MLHKVFGIKRYDEGTGGVLVYNVEGKHKAHKDYDFELNLSSEQWN
jgi:hypothetical protein